MVGERGAAGSGGAGHAVPVHRQTVYRLLPRTQGNPRLPAGVMEDRRQVCNTALQERNDAWRLAGRSISHVGRTKVLTGGATAQIEAMCRKVFRNGVRRRGRARNQVNEECPCRSDAGPCEHKARGRERIQAADTGLPETSGLAQEDPCQPAIRFDLKALSIRPASRGGTPAASACLAQSRTEALTSSSISRALRRLRPAEAAN